MKKRKTILFSALFSMMLTIPVFASGWKYVNGNWYYENNSGDYVTNEWKMYNEDYFYLGDDGIMLTNELIEDGDDYYYVDETGKMVKNYWLQVYDDDDDEIVWFYFKSTGQAKENGYLTIDGVRYHFTDFELDEGWTDGDSGDTYYYGTKDLYEAGWHYIDDMDDDYDYEAGWYYTKASGKLVTDQELKIDGYYYAFDEDGLMLDGFVEFTDDDGEVIYKYYSTDDGHRMDGWIYYLDDDDDDFQVEHEEGWYFLKNGRPYTSDYKTTALTDELGIAKIGSKYYCFDSTGLMQFGIIKTDDGTLYYFGDEDDGAMKTGKVTVERDDYYGYEGTTMYFSTSGVITVKGSDYTGIKNGYLYDNGELVESDDGWQIVEVDGYTYVVNENGKVKTSGTIKDSSDVKWKVVEREDGYGYELEYVSG